MEDDGLGLVSSGTEKAPLLSHNKVVPTYTYTVDDVGLGPADLENNHYDEQKPKASGLFLFVTSWVLFVEGISGISGLAVSFFYKNTLHASPATLTSIGSVSTIPWALKPLFGFVSDGFPIFGYRRKPYIFIAGVLGGASWLLMAWFTHDIWSGAFFMLLGSIGICLGNVLSEALVVERSRGESQEYASKLQSTIWACQAIGSVIAAWTGGWLLTVMSDRSVFVLAGIFPATFMILALITPDRKVTDEDIEVRRSFKDKFAVLFDAVGRPEIAYPCAFIFMLNSTPATGASWFFFYTNVLHFDSEFMGTINLIGSLCSLGGVIIFQKWLKDAAFRSILFWSTIVSTVLGLTQLILIFRWNLRVGIPDGAFCIGESAILSVIGWINTMPILVLASRLCPKGMEGTMYAFIMSVNNLGGIVGSQIGAILTSLLGVTEHHMENFWLLVLICNASTVLPLFLIHWIPQDDPGKSNTKATVDNDGTVHYQDL